MSSKWIYCYVLLAAIILFPDSCRKSREGRIEFYRCRRGISFQEVFDWCIFKTYSLRNPSIGKPTESDQFTVKFVFRVTSAFIWNLWELLSRKGFSHKFTSHFLNFMSRFTPTYSDESCLPVMLGTGITKCGHIESNSKEISWLAQLLSIPRELGRCYVDKIIAHISKST